MGHSCNLLLMEIANVQLTDHDAGSRPMAADMATLSAPLSAVLTDELDGAAAALGVAGDEILVAALGRAIQRTIGVGALSVDVPGHGTSMLAVAVQCVNPEHTSATDLLAGVHQSLAVLTLNRMVHGVLDDPRPQPLSDVLFAYGEAATARAHLGHVLELRTSRGADTMALEWRYDTRSFQPYTVQELAEQFPLALIELTSEAAPPLVATAELAMAH